MSPTDLEIPAEVRERLVHKGALLYAKFCGTDGRGICAESFALFHIWRGEAEVARDFLAFLDAKVLELRDDDPAGRVALTEDLAGRVRRALETEGDEPPPPSRWSAILKAKKKDAPR